MNALLSSGCHVSPALPSTFISPCPCSVLEHPWEVQSGASTFLSVPIYSCMHRKDDKGCPLQLERGEKFMIQVKNL